MASPTSSETNSQGQPFSVSAPFDSDPGADVIFLSGDGLRFFVRKSIVTFVSPIFNDLFSLPQPKAAENLQRFEDGLPVISLSEAGPVVDTLLRFCYPFMSPSSFLESTVDNVIAVHSAAVKYDMESIELALDPLRLRFPKFLLILYKSACDQRLEDKAKGYARDCLSLPLKLIVRLWPSPVLDQTFQSLIEYHQSALSALLKYIHVWSNIRSDTGFALNCQACNSNNLYNAPAWWQKTIQNYMLNITERGPMCTTPDKDSLQLCVQCKAEVLSRWDTLAEGIQRGTGRGVAKVH